MPILRLLRVPHRLHDEPLAGIAANAPLNRGGDAKGVRAKVLLVVTGDDHLHRRLAKEVKAIAFGPTAKYGDND